MTSVRDRLSINRNTFFVAMGFLYAGLISSSITDIIINDIYILYTDVFALVVFVVCTILAIRRTIPFGVAIFICLAQTCLNFLFGSYIISILHPARPMVGYANPQFLLIFGVFGAVTGIGITRWGTVIFGVLALATSYAFSRGLQNSWYYQHWFVMDTVIIVGCMIAVFYYRTLIESLVDRLEKNLKEVGLLKDKAEELHELNKPFVVFGQNTSRLVQDFQNDVIVLENELARLRETTDFAKTGMHLAVMTESVLNLNRRVEWVKYVASATPLREAELLRIDQLVESAVYPFKLQPEYHSSIDFQLDIEKGLAIRGYRRWLLQVIENLIRSACEFDAKTVKIIARPQIDSPDREFLLDLLVSDDGINFQERLQGKELANAMLAAEHMDAQLDIKIDARAGVQASLSLYNAYFLDEL